MALKKQREIKGYTAEYWKITKVNLDLMTATLSCTLGLFKDKPTRDLGENNQLMREAFRWTIPEEFANVSQMTVLEMVAFVYSKITESEIKQRPQLDENYVPVFEEDGITPVMEDYEANWFADAEDILEI